VHACSKVDNGEDGSVSESVGESGKKDDLRVGEGHENGERNP
jgi:hypothetical protein